MSVIRPTADRRPPRGVLRRVAGLSAVALVLIAGTTACRTSGRADRSGSTTTSAAGQNPGTVTTTTPDRADTTLFTATDGRLIAFQPAEPFDNQVLSLTARVDPTDPSSTATEDLRVHDQACFFTDGTGRFLMPVDPGPAGITTPTWGVFQLTGDRVGAFKVELVTTLGSPRSQTTSSSEAPHPYGCAALSDGRMVTTDLGGAGVGEANGQVTLWFPPFDQRSPATSCQLDATLTSPQGVWVDDQDRVHVASPSAPTAGVWRYSRLPIDATPSGGCDAKDPSGAPRASQVRRQAFITGGDHGLQAPTGIALSPTGELFVSSAVNGLINGYDTNGDFVERIMAPPARESLSARSSFTSGTPVGLAVDGVGTLYFADPQWVLGSAGQLVAEPGYGLVQSLQVLTGHKGSPPEGVLDGLSGPTNVTVFDRSSGSQGSKL